MPQLSFFQLYFTSIHILYIYIYNRLLIIWYNIPLCNIIERDHLESKKCSLYLKGKWKKRGLGIALRNVFIYRFNFDRVVSKFSSCAS